MPEEQNAMGPAEKTRPVNDVRHASVDGLDQLGIVLRVVLQVGVLNNHDVTARLLKSATQGGALPTVSLSEENPDVVRAHRTADRGQGHDSRVGCGVPGKVGEELAR